MTFAFTQQVPINEAVYARIIERLGARNDLPQGLILHVAYNDGGVLRYLDVWESEADFERFSEERLHPVVHGVFAEAGRPQPPEPERRQIEVVDIWGAGHEMLTAR